MMTDTNIPVIVASLQHVASTAIFRFLKEEMGICVTKVHKLSWDTLFPYWCDPRCYAPRNFENDSGLRRMVAMRKQIDASWGKVRWKVVTSVRNPLSRFLTICFHIVRTDYRSFRKKINNAVPDCSEQAVMEYIRNIVIPPRSASIDEITGYNWFLIHLGNVFGIDLFSTDFDRRAGFTIYSNDNVDILVLKSERLNEVYKRAFETFLGIENVSGLKFHNLGAEDDQTGALYEKAKTKAYYTRETVDMFCQSRFMQYFYTPDEIEQCRKRWMTGTDPMFFLNLKLYDYGRTPPGKNQLPQALHTSPSGFQFAQR